MRPTCSLLAALAALLCACGGSSAPTKTAPPPPPAPSPSPLEALHTEACACTDDACRDALVPRMTEQHRQFEQGARAAEACLPGFGDAGERVMRKLRTTRDEICACADTACVEAIEARMMAWMMANMDSFKDLHPTPEIEAAADRLDEEMDACRERASAGSAPREVPPPPPPVLGTIEETRAAACACTDRVCRERLTDEVDAQRDRFTELAAKVESCLSSESEPVDEILGVLRSTRDRICACADTACVEGVEADTMKWMMANADKFKDVKPTPAQEADADKIDDDMDRCKEHIRALAPTP